MERHLGPAVAAVADGHVTGAAREQALAHLAGCPRCRAEVEGHRAMRQRLSTLASPDLPAEVAALLLGLPTSRPDLPRGLAPAAPGFKGVPLARPAAHAFGGSAVQRSSRRRRAAAAGVLAVAALSTGALVGARTPAAGGGPSITPGNLELTRFGTTARSMVMDDQGPALAVAVAAKH